MGAGLLVFLAVDACVGRERELVLDAMKEREKKLAVVLMGFGGASCWGRRKRKQRDEGDKVWAATTWGER